MKKLLSELNLGEENFLSYSDLVQIRGGYKPACNLQVCVNCVTTAGGSGGSGGSCAYSCGCSGCGCEAGCFANVSSACFANFSSDPRGCYCNSGV